MQIKPTAKVGPLTSLCGARFWHGEAPTWAEGLLATGSPWCVCYSRSSMRTVLGWDRSPGPLSCRWGQTPSPRLTSQQPLLLLTLPGDVSLLILAQALLGSTALSSCTKTSAHAGGLVVLSHDRAELTDWRTWLKHLSSVLHHGTEGTAVGECLLAGSCEGQDKAQPARQGRSLFFKSPNSFHLKPLRKAESNGSICGLHPVMVLGIKYTNVLSLWSHHPWCDIG